MICELCIADMLRISVLIFQSTWSQLAIHPALHTALGSQTAAPMDERSYRIDYWCVISLLYLPAYIGYNLLNIGCPKHMKKSAESCFLRGEIAGVVDYRGVSFFCGCALVVRLCT